MANLSINLTKDSAKLFKDLWEDKGNWGETPLFDGGQKDKGNLLDLKQKGLITTFVNDGGVFVQFTEMGKAFGMSLT